MGYYQGDAMVMAGGAYPRGGFFKKLRRAVSKFSGWAGKTVGKIGPIVTAINPALGAGLMGIGKAAGMVSRFTSGAPRVSPAAVAPIAPQMNPPPSQNTLTADQVALLQFLQVNGMLRTSRRR